MLKIETLEKINKSLAKHNKTLERQVNKSFVRSEVVGIPLDDVVDVTREYNSSGPREARPLKSQFDVLTVEDFSYFVDNYCEMAKQVDSLKAALRERKEVSESKQAELITVQADNEKLVAEMKKLEAESLELACDNVSWFTHCEKLKAKLEGGKGRANDDGDGNYSVEDGESPNQV
jgi:cell division protein FtsB